MQKPPTLQQQFPDIAAADSTQTTNRSNYTNNLESRKLQNSNLVIIIAEQKFIYLKKFYLFQNNQLKKQKPSINASKVSAINNPDRPISVTISMPSRLSGHVEVDGNFILYINL